MTRALALLALSLFACGESSDKDDTAEDTSISMSDSCEAYLACIMEVMPEATSQMMADYGDDSICWEDEASAATCDTACSNALDDLAEIFPEEPACWGNSDDWTSTVFGDDLEWEYTVESTEGIEGDCGGIEPLDATLTLEGTNSEAFQFVLEALFFFPSNGEYTYKIEEEGVLEEHAWTTGWDQEDTPTPGYSYYWWDSVSGSFAEDMSEGTLALGIALRTFEGDYWSEPHCEFVTNYVGAPQ